MRNVIRGQNVAHRVTNASKRKARKIRSISASCEVGMYQQGKSCVKAIELHTLTNSFSSDSRASKASPSSSTFSGVAVMTHRRKQQEHWSPRSALLEEGCRFML